MSAWVASPEHLSEIAKAIVDLVPVNETPVEVVTVLAHENIASVVYRYEDGTEEEYEGIVTAARIDALRPRQITDPVWIYKLARSLVYQSCEHPEWEKSTACRWLNELEEALQPLLPARTEYAYQGAPEPNPQGYNAAPWGLPA